MPKSNKKSAPKKAIKPGAKYIKQKNLVKNALATTPLNLLRFEDNYFDIMRNKWILEKYILERGLHSTDLLENTLSAFEQAIKAKHPTTISVQLTADEQVICYKESTLARLNGNGYIANSKFSDIQNLTYVGTDNEHVTTLDTVLDLVKGKIELVIEIINPNSNQHLLEEKVLSLLDQYMTTNNLNESVAIMSVNPYVLEWFASRAPHLPRILKSGKFKTKYYGDLKTRVLRKLKLHTIAQADYIAYAADHLPNRYIAKTNPVGVLAYHVHNQNEYKKVAKYCDNIIYTDFEPQI